MLILIVLLTIAAITIGLQRTLYRKQQLTEQAFNQLAPLVSSLSEVAGKTIETLRRLENTDAPEFTQLNQLRWQTTSRELTADEKTTALNQLLLLFDETWQKLKLIKLPPDNPQLTELQHQWKQLAHQLNIEKEICNNAAADFNDTIIRFPFNGLARLLGYRKKTLIHVPQN